jgi:plastocyanin
MARGPDQGASTRGRRMAWRPTTRRVLAAGALALVATACASSSAGGPPPSVDGPAVAVRDYQFEPATLTVESGATVTWVWDGRAPHDVTGQGFHSQEQSSGTFRHTFERPGTYPYECTIHPGMEGSVEVEAGGSATSPGVDEEGS